MKFSPHFFTHLVIFYAKFCISSQMFLSMSLRVSVVRRIFSKLYGTLKGTSAMQERGTFPGNGSYEFVIKTCFAKVKILHGTLLSFVLNLLFVC